MPEKSSVAVQTVSSRPPVKVERTENLFELMDRMYDTIACRAFDLFERGGRLHGHDVDHWLQAEREFLHPVHVQMNETEKEFSVHAEVPGFSAKDIEVNVEPRRLTIRGKRESKKGNQERRNRLRGTVLGRDLSERHTSGGREHRQYHGDAQRRRTRYSTSQGGFLEARKGGAQGRVSRGFGLLILSGAGGHESSAGNRRTD
jgi:HSP20 family molecular chaperone IbpA